MTPAAGKTPAVFTDACHDQVQTGGSFDVDYSVVGPNEKTIMEGSKERQGDFVFTASDVGEYRFCFNNEMSTFAEKMVDFEIAVRPHFPPFDTSCLDTEALLLSRSKTNSALSSPPNKARRPNRPPRWKSRSSSCPASSRPSTATRSTFARGRIATSARFGARSAGFSTSVLSRA